MAAIIVGFVAGFFSGHFGVGGGLVTTPAIRLVLGEPAFIAVGTPLLVNIPAALIGAVSYARAGFVKREPIPYLAGFGALGAIAGARLTPFIGGGRILLVTAIIIFIIGLRFLGERQIAASPRRLGVAALCGSGAAIGVFSGILGLGGGFLLVPFLRIVLGLDIKTTFGTSLAVIVALTVPGAAAHYFLGHVDLVLGLLLTVGVIPGSIIGARVAVKLPGRLLSVMFGLMMVALAVYLGYYEAVRLDY